MKIVSPDAKERKKLVLVWLSSLKKYRAINGLINLKSGRVSDEEKKKRVLGIQSEVFFYTLSNQSIESQELLIDKYFNNNGDIRTIDIKKEINGIVKTVGSLSKDGYIDFYKNKQGMVLLVLTSTGDRLINADKARINHLPNSA